MKLFQIEEPDGSPSDPDMPGAAVGIHIGGAQAEVAVAVGGNPAMLHDREGFERDLPTPPLNDPNGSFGSTAFGTITSAGNPRDFEFAAKLHF